MIETREIFRPTLTELHNFYVSANHSRRVQEAHGSTPPPPPHFGTSVKLPALKSTPYMPIHKSSHSVRTNVGPDELPKQALWAGRYTLKDNEGKYNSRHSVGRLQRHFPHRALKFFP